MTFTVAAGERVALIGPSGAGKSTVLRLAAGLVAPTSGSVTVFDIDTRRLGRRPHRNDRARIGFISQDFSLVGPLRVAGNVASGRLAKRSLPGAIAMLVRPGPIDEISGVLEQVGIPAKIWDRTDQLSGGEQQRTAIARTLFQNPDLLLADEPVSALDPARSESVMEILTNARTSQGANAVVTSMHDASLALEYCNRVIAMRSGQVQFDLCSADVTKGRLDELYRLDQPEQV